MNFKPTDLHTALDFAQRYKSAVDGNDASHREQIKQYCVGDKHQYLGFLEKFLESKTTEQLSREIAFLEFAHKLLLERAAYTNDVHNSYYTNVELFMKHCNEIFASKKN